MDIEETPYVPEELAEYLTSTYPYNKVFRQVREPDSAAECVAFHMGIHWLAARIRAAYEYQRDRDHVQRTPHPDS